MLLPINVINDIFGVAVMSNYKKIYIVEINYLTYIYNLLLYNIINYSNLF